MMLGAFQANIPEEGIYYFFGGFLAMTPMWFGALAATMHLLAKKNKNHPYGVDQSLLWCSTRHLWHKIIHRWSHNVLRIF